MNETFLIGQVAERFGVSLRTIRFYEGKGLLHPVREGTKRRFNNHDVNRLEAILNLKKLGFSLFEVKAMLGRSRNSEIKVTKEMMESQLALLIEQRKAIVSSIASLKNMLKQTDTTS